MSRSLHKQLFLFPVLLIPFLLGGNLSNMNYAYVNLSRNRHSVR